MKSWSKVLKRIVSRFFPVSSNLLTFPTVLPNVNVCWLYFVLTCLYCEVVVSMWCCRKQDKSEIDAGTSACPYCNFELPDYQLSCSECKNNVPYCIATVSLFSIHFTQLFHNYISLLITGFFLIRKPKTIFCLFFFPHWSKM